MDSATQNVMFGSESTEYGTPDWVFQPVQKRLLLNWDMAASEAQHKLPLYATKDGTFVQHFSTPHQTGLLDGLLESWHDKRVWLNPPYGRGITELWVRKAAMEVLHNGCPVAALLLPARTDTEWFHRWVAPYAEIHFMQSRIRFLGAKDSAPFPSIIAVYQTGLLVPHGRINGYSCDLRSDPEFHGGLAL